MDKIADTDHPVHDLVARRWSPRAFESRAVPADDLRAVLEAARWAPSCFNEQPWRFLVARRDDVDAFETMLSCLGESNRVWARNAGALVLTVARETFTHNDAPNAHAWHDVGLASAQLTLEATARGLAVHPMAGIVRDRIREVYAVPDGHAPVTAMAIGYPGSPDALPEALRKREVAPRARRPQPEFVYSGTWGTPASF